MVLSGVGSVGSGVGSVVFFRVRMRAARDRRDALFIVEEGVRGVVARDVGDDGGGGVLVHVDVLQLVPAVQLVQVLRDVPVLEGDSERQREAVEGPRMQQVSVSRVELDRLNGARKLDEAVPEPEEVQPGRIVCPVVHGEGDGVVVQPILNRLEGGEGHHDHDERGDHDEAGAYSTERATAVAAHVRVPLWASSAPLTSRRRGEERVPRGGGNTDGTRTHSERDA